MEIAIGKLLAKEVVELAQCIWDSSEFLRPGLKYILPPSDGEA
jgi:hypothetical protein